MDFGKINSILGKFRRMQDGLQEGGDPISEMEKKLLLSYLDEAKKLISGSETVQTIPEVVVSDSMIELKETMSEQLYVGTNGSPKTLDLENTQSPTEINISEELYSVFDLDDGNEISDKLSQTPIKDLRKSMSINERIFTVQELFSGDQKGFQAILKDLNNLSNLEEARDLLLTNVAVNNGWDNPKKIKKARNFVKLIARRYL